MTSREEDQSGLSESLLVDGGNPTTVRKSDLEIEPDCKLRPSRLCVPNSSAIL